MSPTTRIWQWSRCEECVVQFVFSRLSEKLSVLLHNLGTMTFSYGRLTERRLSVLLGGTGAFIACAFVYPRWRNPPEADANRQGGGSVYYGVCLMGYLVGSSGFEAAERKPGGEFGRDISSFGNPSSSTHDEPPVYIRKYWDPKPITAWQEKKLSPQKGKRKVAWRTRTTKGAANAIGTHRHATHRTQVK